MKSEVTIKERFTPPFVCRGNNIIDAKGSAVVCLGESSDIELDCFVVGALNGEYKRSFSKPLRWIVVAEYYCGCVGTKCPMCEATTCQKGHEVPLFNHCPSCGVRLLTPGEEDITYAKLKEN